MNLFKRLAVIAVILAMPAVLTMGCKKQQGVTLKMATTTSTDNTGLLDDLKPKIFSATGIDLHWVAVGTGKALELGRNCDVDILLVHSPAAEKKFVDEGAGIDRTEVMYNDFIIIGPEKDPAGIKGFKPDKALMAITRKQALFASRGDNSGTNKKEIALWEMARQPVPDREKWYIQTGQGMINTINIAAERDAYTITDRGTYIKYEATHRGSPPLKILVEGDRSLFNQYSVIAVNPKNCKNVKYELSKKLTAWFVSDKVQKEIGQFKLMGKQLFIPNAKK